jgi:protein disulfide-isomerase
MNTTRCTTVALFALSLLFAVASVAPAQEIQWRHDYAAALKESQEKNRPLFVDFYTSQCIWCVKLDAATFKNPGVVDFLNTHFIPLKLDGHRHAKVAGLLWVRRYPTMVLAAPDGTVLSFDEGFVEPITFHLRLRRALADTASMYLTRAEAEGGQE